MALWFKDFIYVLARSYSCSMHSIMSSTYAVASKPKLALWQRSKWKCGCNGSRQFISARLVEPRKGKTFTAKQFFSHLALLKSYRNAHTHIHISDITLLRHQARCWKNGGKIRTKFEKRLVLLPRVDDAATAFYFSFSIKLLRQANVDSKCAKRTRWLTRRVCLKEEDIYENLSSK